MDYNELIKRKIKSFQYFEYWGGSVNNPNLFADWETLQCDKCNIKPEKLKSEKKHSSEMTDRGRLGRRWEKVTIQCPKCKAIAEYETDAAESDESYYSNEERRVYRID
jgi:hypothetical protein